ncbi:MAG: U32 family peptidase [Hyphomicrobiales bacterium]|nr:U32 family peptidase [Hyphomicrobiales bacterium]MCP5370213.1 U32 family peptidase [Hyphomicrobiales bacterium]
MNQPQEGCLTLGPLLFNWAPEAWRDFYLRMADEAPVDVVYLGEVVCSKRAPFVAPHLAEVVERLQAAGKEVVISTLGLIMDGREMDQVRETVAGGDWPVEANDISAAALLRGRPHVIGPGINVYNEGTLAVLAGQGATRVCVPGELPADSIRVLAGTGLAEIEVQVFGRLPLAISARCYHARQRGWEKDSCRYACADDPDGMELDTLDGTPFLAVNGTQTLSRACCNLLAELGDLRAMGVGHFRLSPQDTDMAAVARLFRAVLDGDLDPAEADDRLAALVPAMPFANGFYYGEEGMAFLAAGGGE